MDKKRCNTDDLDDAAQKLQAAMILKTGEKWHVGWYGDGITFVFWFIAKTERLTSIDLSRTRIFYEHDNWDSFVDAESDGIVSLWKIRRETYTDDPFPAFEKYTTALFEIAEQGSFEWYSEEVRKIRQDFIADCEILESELESEQS